MTAICRLSRRPTPLAEFWPSFNPEPVGVSIAKFAEACGLTRKHMSAIINGRASVTAETAARISAVLGTTAQYWLNLQNAVDLYDGAGAIERDFQETKAA